MTLNGIMAVILRYLTEFGSYVKVVNVNPHCLWQKCSPKNLTFGIWLTLIFS